MKFKIGDKVEVVNIPVGSSQGKRKYLRVAFTIDYVNKGSLYPYGMAENKEWMWCDDELELLEDKKVFTKKDLKTGMFGVMDNNKRFVIVDDLVVYSYGGFDRLSEMVNEDDLAWSWNKIDKVFKNCLSFGHLDAMLCEGNISDLVFDRKRDTIKEMTVAEIEKALGYPVKVVKG